MIGRSIAGSGPAGCASIVNWRRLEPTRGEPTHPPSWRASTPSSRGLHAAGVKVILTTCYLPDWATDSYWWSHPPAGYAEGPQAFYPIRDGALGDYRDLAEFLARRYRGKAQALECWNEPNLWPYLYPQRTAERPVLRRPRVPAHAQGVPRRRGARPHGRARRRRRHRPRRPERHLPHQPAALRPLPAASARRALLRRLLPPPVHARRVDLHRPRPAAQRPFAHGHALQPAHAAAPVPRQALLPHGVRLQHAAQPRVRPRSSASRSRRAT